MAPLSKTSKFKFRNKLLLLFLVVFVPLILISKTLVYVQSQKLIEAGIEKELNQSAAFLTDLIKTATGISIQNRLKAIAEKNIEIVEHFYSKYRSGLITRQQAMDSIEEIISSQSVGISGYIYCINSKGDVILHPDPRIKGKNISKLAFVQKLIQVKDGYFEYNWLKTSKLNNENPETRSPKAVFATYYKPLDWIICVSAYSKEFSHLMDINEVNNYTTLFKFRKNGYAFIVDESGNAVMHPFLKGKNLLEQPGEFSKVVQRMLKEKSGKLKTFGLSAPDTLSGEQLVIFRHLPQYKWVVGAASYVDQISTPLNRFSTLISLDILIFLLVFVGLTHLLSRSVTKPLEKFAQALDSSKEGDYSIRLDYSAQDEVGTLARHFNAFMTRMEKYNDQLIDQSQKTIAAQDALKANELKRQVLFNRSFQLISILSSYGIVEDINESQLEFSQCTQTDVLYKPYWDGPWCSHDEKARKNIQQAIDSAAQGQTVRLEAAFVDGDEQIRDVDLSLKPVFSDKHVEFIVAEARDITEIKLAEKERRTLLIQLQKAQKMEAIGTLAGGIAHDFNNILSSIFGYAQLAQMTQDSKDKLNNHMDQILKGAHRASDLVKQILTFSRQAENEKKPLKLHIVLKESLKLLRSSIPTTIEIVNQVNTRDMVNADPTQMNQMIMNLCTNAYHAMLKSGGTLTVSLTTVEQIALEHQAKDYIEPGPFLQLMVKDTGHGMNQEVIEKAFYPYFTTKEMGEGTGLGLALVRAIVEDHNGLSHIESIAEQGTSFFVYLPVVSPKTPAENRTTEIDPLPSPGKETVMVVDDEPDILVLIEELLNKFGYTVHTFTNGESALAAWQEGKICFDMIITDMTMPRMTGIELAQAVLTENRNLPIILCSGFNETISRSNVSAIGVKAFLEKPLDTHQLLSTMRAIFDR